MIFLRSFTKDQSHGQMLGYTSDNSPLTMKINSFMAMTWHTKYVFWHSEPVSKILQAWDKKNSFVAMALVNLAADQIRKLKDNVPSLHC